MPGGVGGNILSYVTFPGAIYDYNGAPPGTRVPLYSLAAGGAVASDTFDLNDAVNGTLWITGKGGEFLVGGASQFPASWNYIAENGNMAPPAGLPLGSPLVGRYAFWVDDEASKININKAWERPNAGVVPDAYSTATAAYGDTSEVDLHTLLAGLSANGVVADINSTQTSPTYSGFATIEEVKLADPVDTDFNANRFSLTAYSDDANYPNYTDDLDVFGVPRRVASFLTEAIDIQNSPLPTNISAYARLSDGNTLGKIYGGTFANKYPVVGVVDGVKQIIANIIAYQHDPQTPIAVDPQAFPPDGGPAGLQPTYLGLARTPYINEVQVKYTDNGDGTVTRTTSVELFYPYSADATYTSGAAGSEDTIVVSGLPTGTPATFGGGVTITVLASTLFSSGTPQFFSKAEIITLAAPPPPPVTITISPTTIMVNYYRAGHRIDFAQLSLGVNPISLSVPGSPLVGPSVYHGAEVKDPWVNEDSSQWVPYDNVGGSLGNPNSTVYTPTANILSKAHIRAAPMQSVGELGFIHTPTTLKYLTLQGGAAAGVIPDWAMLDLFTVANAKTAGRININSLINPQSASGDPVKARLVPLNALLFGLAGLPATAAADITADIRADPYGIQQTAAFGVFDTIGEVCEIPNMTTGPDEAAKEAAIRRIANLITVRSSTFTIWVIAQSIKQPPPIPVPRVFTPGVDQITGEVRAQAVVERYESPPGSAPQFRVRYFRYLYN